MVRGSPSIVTEPHPLMAYKMWSPGWVCKGNALPGCISIRSAPISSPSLPISVAPVLPRMPRSSVPYSSYIGSQGRLAKTRTCVSGLNAARAVLLVIMRSFLHFLFGHPPVIECLFTSSFRHAAPVIEAIHLFVLHLQTCHYVLV